MSEKSQVEGDRALPFSVEGPLGFGQRLSGRGIAGQVVDGEQSLPYVKP